MGISSIDVEKVVKDFRHSPVAAKDVAQWFKDETITLNFGEYVGRPSANLTMHKEYLVKFLENGWTIDAVMSQTEEGEWKAVSESTGSNVSTTDRSSNTVTTNSSSTSSSRRGDSNNYSTSQTSTSQSTSGTTEGSVTNGSTASASSQSGAYYCAYQRIRLKRRRMQPEKVLQSMVTDFTAQYNDGKSLEDSRYNEIITLYAMTLSHTEAECNEILTHGSDLSGLYQKYLKSVDIAVTGANNAAAQVSQTAQQAALDEMRRNFAALIAQAEAKMISNGTYNSTVWPSVLAGLERQRQEALNKAKADSANAAVTAWTSVANVKGGVYAQMLAAGQAMIDALDKRMMSVTDARNSVVKWIVDFISTREEVYPELQEIAQLTERLGFSVGAAGNVL